MWSEKFFVVERHQLTDSSKGRKKAELLDLCKKTAAVKHIKPAASAVGQEISTHFFCNFPEFLFDVCHQLSIVLFCFVFFFADLQQGPTVICKTI